MSDEKCPNCGYCPSCGRSNETHQVDSQWTWTDPMPATITGTDVNNHDNLIFMNTQETYDYSNETQVSR